jgi:hypothetical protein
MKLHSIVTLFDEMDVDDHRITAVDSLRIHFVVIVVVVDRQCLDHWQGWMEKVMTMMVAVVEKQDMLVIVDY